MKAVPQTLGVCALAAAMAGCGGSTYTKHDFSVRADAICAATLRQLRALAPPNFGGPSTHKRLALTAYLHREAELIRSEVAQLRSIGLPNTGTHAGTELLHRYLAAMNADATAWGDLAAAQGHGIQTQVASAQAQLIANPAESIASRYGLGSCATAGGTNG